jgi:hypothetical protein
VPLLHLASQGIRPQTVITSGVSPARPFEWSHRIRRHCCTHSTAALSMLKAPLRRISVSKTPRRLLRFQIASTRSSRSRFRTSQHPCGQGSAGQWLSSRLTRWSGVISTRGAWSSHKCS